MENPASAFSAGFNKASDAVDTAFTPRKWGQDAPQSKSSPRTSAKPAARTGFEIEKYQIRDTEAIMQAVVNGDVASLSRQQQELAANLLRKLQRS